MLTETQPQPQPQQRPVSCSAALANRSFLYGGGGASAAQAAAASLTPTNGGTCLVDQKIVYAALDGLALKRAATLPQQLNGPPLRPRDRQQLPAASSTRTKSSARVGPDLENRSDESKQQQQQQQQHQTALNHGYTFPGLAADQRIKNKRKKKKKSSSGKDAAADGNEEHKRFAFAKNVLHYVPMQSRRYYRKSRKLASKSLSLKSLGHQRQDADRGAAGSLKCRSLSRDELKYISISQPSNFVHVDSGDRFRLSRRPCGEYAELAVLRNGGSPWQQSQREDDDDYDDVGPPVAEAYSSMQETLECKAEDVATKLVEELKEEEEEEEEDMYDDVGPPVLRLQRDDDVGEREEELEDRVYDDVGPLRRDPESCAKQDTTKEVEESGVAKETDAEAEEEEVEEKEEEEPQETYEIPQAPPSLEEENPEEAPIELRQSCVDEENDDVYDDVGPAVVPQNARAQEAHERVNSLYSGSVHVYDKDSEWEDLDEPSIYQANPPRNKKKNGGPRWSCKLRRQRSKASRKSSARSTSRNSRSTTRPGNHAAASGGSLTEAPPSDLDDSVAVSLGTGSILLLGSVIDDHTANEQAQRDNDDEGKSNQRQRDNDDFECKGLLQLRVVLADDEAQEVHESSLYVAEDSSDDGNYETLQTYEPDDFSSDSEAEESSGSVPSLQQQQPPSRPIPPPPREESLGHSLGRRMKILRRTWSITKGSLGRMRRRASAEVEDTANQPPPAGHYDPRKYFSFKKHFRKSQSGQALSTFYLDKSLSSEAGSEKESAASDGNEPIYSNADWYKEVGLYSGNGSQHESSFEQLPPMDHYSVLAEEPLYQFYAADATRVAFESDSDGYEEVEELTPSSATTDLARPGHRTLWCQTPQVINSGLLLSMTMEERKIQEAKFEILTSEASYLNSLRVLENEFASNHELVHEILTASEREKLFGTVPDVLVVSERFLAELEGIWREDPMLSRLSELLLKHADKCANVYVEYCSNQVNIDATLKELKAKKGYRYLETLSKIEMQPACHSLSLHSFLMLPMQRITRLPLLADAVLSKLTVEHNERLSWERVLSSLSQIVAKCNEAARLAERRNEMDALARKLEYPVKVAPIDLRERELIRSGTVVHLSSKSDTEYKLTFGKKFHKTPLMLMLLTDYLLVTKLKSNSNEETYSVMETCKRSLVALESAPEDGPFQGRHAMVLTLLENQAGRQVEFVLTCDNDTEKERWLDAVSPPKPSCVGETLYESWDCPQVMALYSYSPRQPDEITLQPGDVINVLRKMNDGWLFGEKLLDGEQGWFPGNFTKEVASEHVRARNLRQRHRFLALSGSVLQRKAKQSLSLL